MLWCVVLCCVVCVVVCCGGVMCCVVVCCGLFLRCAVLLRFVFWCGLVVVDVVVAIVVFVLGRCGVVWFWFGVGSCVLCLFVLL